MRVSEEQLRAIIIEALRKNPKYQQRLLEARRRKAAVRRKQALKESSDYMAGRQVIISAQQASLDFEQEIIKVLDLVPPDDLHPNLRTRFNDVVEAMRDDIVASVKRAVEQLAPFPRNEDKSKGSEANQQTQQVATVANVVPAPTTTKVIPK